MRVEIISRRETMLIRRLVLEPGEELPWHADVCESFTVIVRGERLRIEMRDGEAFDVLVAPGMAEWSGPERRIHRAVNVGASPYEEVTTFLLPSPDVDPQPSA